MASTVKFDVWRNASGLLNSTVIQTKFVSSATRTTINSTTFVEASEDYRVEITPRFANSLIYLNYYIPANPGASYQANTIYTFRAFRSIGGSKTYDLTSAGETNGNRMVYAGRSLRPPGYDLNDPMWISFPALDHPNTISSCQYGFELMRESGGTGTLYLGYSATDLAIIGFNHDIVIVAQEIVQ